MRKKDAEIGTEEEETKNDQSTHTNSTKYRVSGTIQTKNIADEITNKSVFNNTSNIDTISAKLDLLPCESLEIKKEVLQGKTESETPEIISKDSDNADRLISIPLVDKHAQGALRRRIVHEQLDRV